MNCPRCGGNGRYTGSSEHYDYYVCVNCKNEWMVKK